MTRQGNFKYFWLGLRLGNQFGQRVKVMAKDLRAFALTHGLNRHPYPDLNPSVSIFNLNDKGDSNESIDPMYYLRRTIFQDSF